MSEKLRDRISDEMYDNFQYYCESENEATNTIIFKRTELVKMINKTLWELRDRILDKEDIITLIANLK